MKKRRRRAYKLDYTKLTAIDVYDCLLAGKILKFPNGFVTPSNMKEILREVILNRQKLKREQICENISADYLRNYNLGGAIKAFDTKIYDLVKYCFPEFEIEQWELKKLPNGFWFKEENRKRFMLWVVKKEKIDTKSIEDLKRIDAKLIQDYGGSKALKHSSVYSLILMVAEIEVKEWQVIKMSSWTDEKAISAIKWLIDEKLKWSHEEVVENISANVFRENNLDGLLSKHCEHSPIKALQLAYPGEYTELKNKRPEYLRRN